MQIPCLHDLQISAKISTKLPLKKLREETKVAGSEATQMSQRGIMHVITAT